MKQTEYIIANNRLLVSVARYTMDGVLGDYGVPDEEVSQVQELLRKMEEKLFASYEVEKED